MDNKYKLPDYCFAQNMLELDKIIIIKYGESGYYDTGFSGDAMEYNEKIGVTIEEMHAMICGSMFNWRDMPGINPESYKK